MTDATAPARRPAHRRHVTTPASRRPAARAALAALSMILLVMTMLAFIAWNGVQVFVADGLSLGDVLSPRWFPSSEQSPSFGLLPFLAGTAGVTGLGVMLGAPVAVALALYLSDVAPPWAKAVVQPAMEVFVGVPSVVWGWLGITTLVPFLRTNFGWAGFTLGFSWLAGSLVLAVMILPTVTAVAFDAFRVPDDLRAASHALGGRGGRRCATLSSQRAAQALRRPSCSAPRVRRGRRSPSRWSSGTPGDARLAGPARVTTLTSQITLDMGNPVFGEPGTTRCGRWCSCSWWCRLGSFWWRAAWADVVSALRGAHRADRAATLVLWAIASGAILLLADHRRHRHRGLARPVDPVPLRRPILRRRWRDRPHPAEIPLHPRRDAADHRSDRHLAGSTWRSTRHLGTCPAPSVSRRRGSARSR